MPKCLACHMGLNTLNVFLSLRLCPIFSFTLLPEMCTVLTFMLDFCVGDPTPVARMLFVECSHSHVVRITCESKPL